MCHCHDANPGSASGANSTEQPANQLETPLTKVETRKSLRTTVAGRNRERLQACGQSRTLPHALENLEFLIHVRTCLYLPLIPEDQPPKETQKQMEYQAPDA